MLQILAIKLHKFNTPVVVLAQQSLFIDCEFISRAIIIIFILCIGMHFKQSKIKLQWHLDAAFA